MKKALFMSFNIGVKEYRDNFAIMKDSSGSYRRHLVRFNVNLFFFFLNQLIQALNAKTHTTWDSEESRLSKIPFSLSDSTQKHIKLWTAEKFTLLDDLREFQLFFNPVGQNYKPRFQGLPSSSHILLLLTLDSRI